MTHPPAFGARWANRTHLRVERVCILIMGLAIVCELVWSGIQQRSIDDLTRIDRETVGILGMHARRIDDNWKDLRGEDGLCVRFPRGTEGDWTNPDNGQVLPNLYAQGEGSAAATQPTTQHRGRRGNH